MMGLRAAPALRLAIEDWANEQPDEPCLSDAIRRLVELGLAGAQPIKRRNPKAEAKASDMAGKRIDKLANPAIPEEERRARKRRLIKGPREFRDMRSDQPKPKV
jgi:hypothetical protein